MSISIMTMSSEKLNSHSTDYTKLCQDSSEGIYVNAVEKDTLDQIAKQFFSKMDIYPSFKRDSIREFFGTF